MAVSGGPWPRWSAVSLRLYWLCWLAVCLLGVTSQRIYREDQLALLSGTLRTFQVASCDGELLRLECPAGTTVSIQLVQYGRLATNPTLCGSAADMRRFNYTDCMDRSALKVVIDACVGKRQCQLRTSAALFGVDPCPGISKFVEVAYKCRPTEFRTKVVCQGQRRPIYCDQHRVAIYSASFGTERRGSVHCPQPPGVRLTDCHSSLTSEKMISWCQGKPSCELSADPELFTRSCPPDHNMYLTTKYTCVPKEILKERYASQVDEDYQQNMTEAPSAELEDPVEPSEMEARDVPSVDENGQERLILYLTLGVTVCLLVGLGFLVGRLCMRRKAKGAGPEPAPPGFTGFQRPDSELDLSMGRSTVGSGHITPPPHATVSFQPSLPSDPSRYHVPCRERERHSPVTYRTAPSDNYRTAYFGAGTGGYRENLIGEHSSAGSLHRGAGDSVRGRDPVYGRFNRPLVPELGDELRSAASSDSGDRQAASPFETLKRLDALERRRPCQTGSDSSYGHS